MTTCPQIENLAIQSDEQLVDRMKAGEDRAFMEVYKRYRGVLYVFACRIADDEAHAEDLVQEVFLSLWDHRSSLRLSGSLSSYLYSAVRYRFFDWVDKQRVRRDYARGFGRWLDQEPIPADSKVLADEFEALVEEALSHLPETMRRIFELSHKQQLSNQEIAELTGLSEKTIRNNLSGALKALRHRLGPYRFLMLFACYLLKAN